MVPSVAARRRYAAAVAAILDTPASLRAASAAEARTSVVAVMVVVTAAVATAITRFAKVWPLRLRPRAGESTLGRAVFPTPVDAMRLLLALALVLPLIAACTPYIPLKTDFGTSAAVTKGDIPPEYAGFNAYDPNVNPVLAQQICATPYQPSDITTAAASPGQLVTAHGTCAPHQPIIGN